VQPLAEPELEAAGSLPVLSPDGEPIHLLKNGRVPWIPDAAAQLECSSPAYGGTLKGASFCCHLVFDGERIGSSAVRQALVAPRCL
jgi:hypothetical protein